MLSARNGAIAAANARATRNFPVEGNGVSPLALTARTRKNDPVKRYVGRRSGCTPYDSVRFRNSTMVSRATMAATAANTGTGARRMSASTIGMRTTAVAMRFNKGFSEWDVYDLGMNRRFSP